MSKKNTIRWCAEGLLAVALTGCGTLQGATPAQVGIGLTDGAGDDHPTIDANAIALDQLNEQQRLSEQGSSAPRIVVRDPENPAFGRNTIGSFTPTSAPIVRDPANPAYSGAIGLSPMLLP